MPARGYFICSQYRKRRCIISVDLATCLVVRCQCGSPALSDRVDYTTALNMVVL
jgi:hypothetical protein